MTDELTVEQAIAELRALAAMSREEYRRKDPAMDHDIIHILLAELDRLKAREGRDPAESRLIVRQTALKAAVELHASARVPGEWRAGSPEILATAEDFVAWILEARK